MDDAKEKYHPIQQDCYIYEFTEISDTWRKTWMGWNQTKPQPWEGKWTKSHPQIRCLQLVPAGKGKSIFSNGVTLGISLTLQGKPHAEESLADIKQTPWFFVFVFVRVCVHACVHFCFIVHVCTCMRVCVCGFVLVWFLFFIFCFVFSLLKERCIDREHEVG